MQRSKAQSGHWIERSEFDSPEVNTEVLIPFSDEVRRRVGNFAHARISQANAHDLRADAI
ncbi:MAG: hypothetical protein R2815_06095 [Flavobacteriales bacterium]